MVGDIDGVAAFLGAVVEAIRQEFPQVDYFPSYEIALSFGVPGYQDDNIHLRPEVIERIMAAMRRTYF